jgi:hypothetical protein
LGDELGSAVFAGALVAFVVATGGDHPSSRKEFVGDAKRGADDVTPTKKRRRVSKITYR